MGLNGCGKSTLIKLITNVTKSPKGNATRHPRLRIRYYSRLAIEDLRAAGLGDPTMTAFNTLAAEAEQDMEEGGMRALLGSFSLPGRVASDVPVAKLSGGQLVRA